MSTDAYTTIVTNLWGYDKRNTERNQSQPFRNSMNIWNKGQHNNSRKVGSILEFLNATNPSSRQEFAKQYLNSLRSPEQVVAMVEEFASKSGLTFQVALNWWWIRVIDMSFTGWEAEAKILEMVKVQLQGTGNDIRKATDEEDRTFGVDLIIFNIETKEDIEGLQVKPASYFRGQSASNIEAREKINPDKFKKYYAARGAAVRYVEIEDSLRYGYPIYKETHKSFKTPNKFDRLY